MSLGWTKANFFMSCPPPPRFCPKNNILNSSFFTLTTNLTVTKFFLKMILLVNSCEISNINCFRLVKNCVKCTRYTINARGIFTYSMLQNFALCHSKLIIYIYSPMTSSCCILLCYAVLLYTLWCLMLCKIDCELQPYEEYHRYLAAVDAVVETAKGNLTNLFIQFLHCNCQVLCGCVKAFIISIATKGFNHVHIISRYQMPYCIIPLKIFICYNISKTSLYFFINCFQFFLFKD